MQRAKQIRYAKLFNFSASREDSSIFVLGIMDGGVVATCVDDGIFFTKGRLGY